jgi:hypothetical protein
MFTLGLDDCLLHQAKRAVTAHLASNIVDIDASDRDPYTDGTIDITQTNIYNPRNNERTLESPSSQACGGISGTRRERVFLSASPTH